MFFQKCGDFLNLAPSKAFCPHQTPFLDPPMPQTAYSAGPQLGLPGAHHGNDAAAPVAVSGRRPAGGHDAPAAAGPVAAARQRAAGRAGRGLRHPTAARSHR